MFALSLISTTNVSHTVCVVKCIHMFFTIKINVVGGIISRRGFQASLSLYLHTLNGCSFLESTRMMVSVIDIETFLHIPTTMLGVMTHPNYHWYSCSICLPLSHYSSLYYNNYTERSQALVLHSFILLPSTLVSITPHKKKARVSHLSLVTNWVYTQWYITTLAEQPDR